MQNRQNQPRITPARLSTRIILPRKLLEKIIAHSRSALPNEACGLFAGHINEADKRVEEVYCLKNIDESPEHFSMSGEEQFAAIADMRKRGLTLLGNFHSHPSTPARPSEEDIRLAFDSSLSYIIVSLADAEPALKSFNINKNENSAAEETVEYTS
ncbi:MAG: M67 family metallopeptidase [Spirochaetaceae bacterium]|jgi:proteasome lid subunit RPN8/RPN11|nr:M67 family metallopeptidase [Spirochaetaceae bacterium]